MKEETIKQITNRFLGWKLPDDFHPDCGISYTQIDDRFNPIGTNLFDYTQAENMIKYILGDTLDTCTCSGLSCDCPIHTKDKFIN